MYDVKIIQKKLNEEKYSLRQLKGKKHTYQVYLDEYPELVAKINLYDYNFQNDLETANFIISYYQYLFKNKINLLKVIDYRKKVINKILS